MGFWIWAKVIAYGEASRALRFVLQGAEASRRDATLRQLLTEDAELSARFARDTADRLILATVAIEARMTAARAADQFVSSTELLRMAVEATLVPATTKPRDARSNYGDIA